MAGVIPEDLKPCTRGIPCSEKGIEWFGFVTIPLLSLLAFSAVIAFLFMAHSRSKQ
jgi:disulfide bond formation protein DsbB